MCSSTHEHEETPPWTPWTHTATACHGPTSGWSRYSYECVVSLGESDFTHDLERFDVPTLLIHGDDDQVVPVDNSERSARIIPNAKDIYYRGAPHGLTSTHQDQVNDDLLTFLES